MRVGFSIKELSKHLDKDPRKVGDFIDPKMREVAKLWMRNPTKTMLFLMDTVQTLQRIHRSEMQMSEAEIDARILMAKGRYDEPLGLVPREPLGTRGNGR